MKNFTKFACVMIAVLAVSCQSDSIVEQHDISNNNEAQELSYAISEEEALKNLDRELTCLYGETTRTKERRIRKIEPINSSLFNAQTRSADTPADNLLYVVEFEGDNGSAILGADRRVEGVFAILDKGIISSEDFKNAANGENNEKINTYLAGLIANKAIEQASKNRAAIIPPLIEDLKYGYFVYDTLVNESRECYLRTKWSQDEPFNNLCYNEDGEKCKAGCVTIAGAQALLYAYPDTRYITLDDEIFDKELLNMKRYGVTIPTNMQASVDHEVARYVYKFATLINTDLEPDASNGYLTHVASLFNELEGFESAEYCNICDTTFTKVVRDQLYINGLPTIMHGAATGQIYGHAWAIDAYKHLLVNTYLYTKQGNVLISKELFSTENVKKVHCNFGWSGNCDGYYTFNIFDLTDFVSSEDRIPEIGDNFGAYSSDSYIYDNLIAIVKYSLE